MDVEKTIEFILEQQANFSVRLEQHREQVAAEMSAHRAQVAAEMSAHRAQVAEETGQFFGVLKTWVERFEERAHNRDLRMDRLEEKMESLIDTVNVLTHVVDGLVRRGDGHAPAQ